jgi:hypothetical protein
VGAKTGKKLREFSADTDAVSSLAFSPDGHTLASTGSQDKPVGLWDVETGKGLLDLTFRTANGVLAYSPDGKILACGSAAAEIWLWETASKQWRRKFAGHSAFVHSLAFSPNGKLLVSGSMDTTALVWDTSGLGNEPRTPASEEKLHGLWNTLASSDAEKAGQAIWTLTADADRAIPFIVKRLREQPPTDRERMPKLVADLGSPTFKVREAAETGLTALAKLAEPALRQALARQPSLEVHRLIERLLAKRESVALPQAALQTLRALEVLEHIGSPAARQALEDLAGALSEAYFAQEAKAAADRLGRFK